MRFMQSTLQFDTECRDGRCVELLGARSHLDKRSDTMDDILGTTIESCGKGDVLACLSRPI